MEDELRCPCCRRLYTNPVTLPCCHRSLCLQCATARLQSPYPAAAALMAAALQSSPTAASVCSPASSAGSEDGSASSSSGPDSDPDSDGMSVVSETDSGVVVVCRSRPGSCVGTPSILSGSLHQLSAAVTPTMGMTCTPLPVLGSLALCRATLVCPVCTRTVAVDGGDIAAALAPTRGLENIVDRYRDVRQLPVDCQICGSSSPSSSSSPPGSTSPSSSPQPATTVCEQCEIFYCDACVERFHPSTGGSLQNLAAGSSSSSSASSTRNCLTGSSQSLTSTGGGAGHRLLPVGEGRTTLRTKHRAADAKCSDHGDESLSMYCVLCKTTVCCVCIQDGRHFNHHAQPMGAMCKAQKVGPVYRVIFVVVFVLYNVYSSCIFVYILSMTLLP